MGSLGMRPTYDSMPRSPHPAVRCSSPVHGWDYIFMIENDVLPTTFQGIQNACFHAPGIICAEQGDLLFAVKFAVSGQDTAAAHYASIVLKCGLQQEPV